MILPIIRGEMSDFWNSAPPSTFANEADVEHQLVVPLLDALGYEKTDIVPKYPVEFREGRRGRKPEADFVCFNGMPHDRNNSLLVVEAKDPDEALTDGKEQGESYAANLRAPLLLLTNGRQLQAWQLQPTRESEKVIDIAVADMIGNRGTIEKLLSKKALATLTINRTLRDRGGNENKMVLPSDRLISAHPRGAIILAPSGFGKSTLSHQILEHALRKCSTDEEAPLPFLIPLPAIEPGMGSLLRFMQQRLVAYSPGETADTLRQMLRTSGAIIICDAFDRVAIPFRTEVQSELSNTIRDFPRVQLIVFSRESVSPELPLPRFDLAAPSDEELRDLEVLVLGHTQRSAFVTSMMPKTLRNICENILVARLVFEYWKGHGQYPVELGLLFRAWLDGLLHAANNPSSKIVWQESSLTLLADASADAPIPVYHWNFNMKHLLTICARGNWRLFQKRNYRIDWARLRFPAIRFFQPCSCRSCARENSNQFSGSVYPVRTLRSTWTLCGIDSTSRKNWRNRMRRSSLADISKICWTGSNFHWLRSSPQCAKASCTI